MMKDFMQQDSADLGKRLMVLRYDHRMGVIVAYVPKEKGKGQQLWQKLKEDSNSITNSHGKLFRQLKRPENAETKSSNKKPLKEWWSKLEHEASGGDDSGDSNSKRELPSQKEQAAKKDNGLPLAMNLKKILERTLHTQALQKVKRRRKQKT